MRWIKRFLVLIALAVVSTSLAALTDFVVFKYGHLDSPKTPGSWLLLLRNLGSRGIGGGIVAFIGSTSPLGSMGLGTIRTMANRRTSSATCGARVNIPPSLLN